MATNEQEPQQEEQEEQLFWLLAWLDYVLQKRENQEVIQRIPKTHDRIVPTLDTDEEIW